MSRLAGTIIAILETWPLQLQVDVGPLGVRDVSLTESCAIVRGGRAVDASRLRVGGRIAVEGPPGAAGGVTAQRIELLD